CGNSQFDSRLRRYWPAWTHSLKGIELHAGKRRRSGRVGGEGSAGVDAADEEATCWKSNHEIRLLWHVLCRKREIPNYDKHFTGGLLYFAVEIFFLQKLCVDLRKERGIAYERHRAPPGLSVCWAE